MSADDDADDATDNVYLSLAETHGDDARWAFGTGFTDPLHGVDTTVPEEVDRAELAATCLALADDALVAAQRLAEWCTRAPELEEEVALANIGLDLIGQARLLYTRTGTADGTGRDEDDYAYRRDPDRFRNLCLAELPNEDFAFTMVRLLALSSWRLSLLARLRGHRDPLLAAVAAKSVTELAYHRRYAADWVLRLADGTDESRSRTVRALEELAPWLPELVEADAEAAADALSELQQVLGAARLTLPQVRDRGPAEAPAGREGVHTAHLAPLLDELQGLARAHPGARW
ncbi:1,2-phenylacetyl-CoA epoxidase subunit PaaC [Phaeacidiphilus oryzae]|uniref:1,2-phenylacetyl-CoA epoxidase subunit PaaC n=1 Tax=Phaeacidiphilus oryzae TaxID=348818 RepID=UPI000569C88E|nr:1,2-phenylacetyl-CoA epoxidase subunit PaaC [Phaeacidiphilus oryzae]